jgi:DNA-binding GntR family transcriptional regulator
MIQTLTEHAYDRIRELLVSGRLAPGTRLSDVELSHAIGISRTPVREAISKLVSEGLVDHRPRAGVFVKTLQRRELEELYELREWLESCAAGAAAQRMDSDRLTTLLALCEEMEEIAAELERSGKGDLDADAGARLAVIDTAFHVSIIQATGNSKVVKTVSDLHIMTTIFGHRYQLYPPSAMRGFCDSHRKLADALADGDAEAARREMAGHISRGKALVLAFFDEQAGRGAAGSSLAPDYPESLREIIHQIELNPNGGLSREHAVPGAARRVGDVKGTDPGKRRDA